MPTFTDPAPCEAGANLYECVECLNRLCREERIGSCPECGERMENLTKPRSE